LLKEHEILNAPSASSIVALRQQKQKIGPKTLAVLADPVFSTTDPNYSILRNRSTQDTCAPLQIAQGKPIGGANLATQPKDLQRTLREFNLKKVEPLPKTRDEAENILSLVPPEQRSASCGFSANYSRVMTPQEDPLDQYRMVHIATHGYVIENNPQYSGIVLSLVNPQGKTQAGLLHLYDIFNLRLAADLVVLSAYQTGMGKDIKGEGLISFTRGFMYAGSRRVITSLWSVNDELTSDLMSEVDRRMLQQKQTPIAALRGAQLKMWEKNPAPRTWAAFTLQGEWRP
jgi:CHAT domain-containing protein